MVLWVPNRSLPGTAFDWLIHRFVMVAGYLPFDEPSLSTLFRRIQNADYTCPPYPAVISHITHRFFSPELRDLIAKIFVPDPTARISLAEVPRGYAPSHADQAASLVPRRRFGRGTRGTRQGRARGGGNARVSRGDRADGGAKAGGGVFGAGNSRNRGYFVGRQRVLAAADGDSVLD